LSDPYFEVWLGQMYNEGWLTQTDIIAIRKIREKYENERK